MATKLRLAVLTTAATALVLALAPGVQSATRDGGPVTAGDANATRPCAKRQRGPRPRRCTRPVAAPRTPPPPVEQPRRDCEVTRVVSLPPDYVLCL